MGRQPDAENVSQIIDVVPDIVIHSEIHVSPNGVEAVRKEENVGFGTEETPNGRIVGAAGNHVIANWLKGPDDVSAVHDLATGAVQATAPCRTKETEYGADVPSPKNLAEVRPALVNGAAGASPIRIRSFYSRI